MKKKKRKKPPQKNRERIDSFMEPEVAMAVQRDSIEQEKGQNPNQRREGGGEGNLV